MPQGGNGNGSEGLGDPVEDEGHGRRLGQDGPQKAGRPGQKVRTSPPRVGSMLSDDPAEGAEGDDQGGPTEWGSLRVSFDSLRADWRTVGWLFDNPAAQQAPMM